MLYGRLSRLGYISKTLVKKSTVANPYQRKPVGIGIFVVPKFTSAPPKHANCPWTAGTPIHSKEGREVIDQTPAATEHAPGKATPASKGDERAAQTNGHIIRKKSGKTYNPALLVDPSPPPFATEEGAGLPGHILTARDLKLRLVYGDHVHRNYGMRLMGGITDNALWKTWWRRISNLTPRFYDTPKGKAGTSFVTLLVEELRGTRERRWNSKRPMVFIGTVLAKIQGVKKSKYIRARLLRRMDH